MTVHSASLSGTPATLVKSPEFPLSPTIIPGVVRALDAAIFITCGMVSLFFGDAGTEKFSYWIFSVIFVCFFYIILANFANLYSINAVMRPIYRSDDIVISIITSFLLFHSVALGLNAGDKFLLIQIISFILSSIVSVVLGRILICKLFGRLSKRGVIGHSMAVLGVGEQSRRFLRRLSETNPYFVSVIGVFSDEPVVAGGSFEGKPVLGDAEALVTFARGHKVDDIVIAMPWNADRKLTALVETLKELPVNVHLSTDLAGFELAFRPVMGNLTELPIFEVVQRPISGWSSALKAIEDYVLAGILLLITAPIMLAIAIAIKIDTPGPVFFKQKRLGFNNKEFAIYKFRSMYHREIPEAVVRQASRGDPRVTRVGRLIRATSLDELPQLLNVLNGTMSLVGPRPHALSHNEEYGRSIRGYFARHRVKPGITGWAQVKGFRGETETLEKMEARIRHDIYYAENWSILFDIRILMMTVIFVFFQKSAY